MFCRLNRTYKRKKDIIKNLFPVLIAGIIFLISGCMPGSERQYISPEYKNLNEFNASVLVIPYKTKFAESNQITEADSEIKEDPKPITNREIELFDNYITPILSENTWAKLFEPNKEFKTTNLRLSSREIDTDKKQKKVLLIPNSKGVVCNGVVPQYVLLFEKLFFIKNFDEKMVGLGSGTSSSYTINGGVEYVLWDNVKGKIAAYGSISKNLPLLSPPTKEEYLFLIENFASKIIKESPLAAKKVYY